VSRPSQSCLHRVDSVAGPLSGDILVVLSLLFAVMPSLVIPATRPDTHETPPNSPPSLRSAAKKLTRCDAAIFTRSPTDSSKIYIGTTQKDVTDTATQDGHTASEIVPRLYISDVEIATNKSVLESLNITHILSVMLDHDIPKLNLPKQPIRYAVPILDRPNAPLLPELSGAVNFITNALTDPTAHVLCHCYAGASRSPTVVIAYLLSSMNLTVDEALSYVRVRRSITRPNPGFVQQLRTWDEDRRNNDVRAAKRRRIGPQQIEGTMHGLRRRDDGAPDRVIFVGLTMDHVRLEFYPYCRLFVS